MLVSHRNKFTYTKTAKTASTTVESYFEPFCMPQGEWQFAHAREGTVSAAGIIGYRGAKTEGKQCFNHMYCKVIREQGIPLAEFYDQRTCEVAAEVYSFELDFFAYQPPL